MIVITQGAIIKVVDIDSEYYIGFNMITESYVKVPQSICVELTENVAKELLSNESLRWRIANDFTEKVNKMGALMGVSNRTVHRIQKDCITA